MIESISASRPSQASSAATSERSVESSAQASSRNCDLLEVSHWSVAEKISSTFLQRSEVESDLLAIPRHSGSEFSIYHSPELVWRPRPPGIDPSPKRLTVGQTIDFRRLSPSRA